MINKIGEDTSYIQLQRPNEAIYVTKMADGIKLKVPHHGEVPMSAAMDLLEILVGIITADLARLRVEILEPRCPPGFVLLPVAIDAEEGECQNL